MCYYILINNKIKKKKVVEIGTGYSHKIVDIIDTLNIDVKDKRMGTMFERKDNKANIDTLKDLGWSPKINLIDYLREETSGDF